MDLSNLFSFTSLNYNLFGPDSVQRAQHFDLIVLVDSFNWVFKCKIYVMLSLFSFSLNYSWSFLRQKVVQVCSFFLRKLLNFKSTLKNIQPWCQKSEKAKKTWLEKKRHWIDKLHVLEYCSIVFCTKSRKMSGKLYEYAKKWDRTREVMKLGLQKRDQLRKNRSYIHIH